MKYKNRYSSSQMQAAYKNAIDVLYFGYTREFWNCCGLDQKNADKVWLQALSDISEI